MSTKLGRCEIHPTEKLWRSKDGRRICCRACERERFERIATKKKATQDARRSAAAVRATADARVFEERAHEARRFEVESLGRFAWGARP